MKSIIYTASILLAIFLDSFTKNLAATNLKPIGSLPIVEGVFHLTYAENTGAAFSMLRGKQTFLVIVTALAMVMIFIYLVKISAKGAIYLDVALCMVLAGGIGNLIDRVRFGYVVDFFDFRLINFAIFNVADVFITLGVVLLIIDTFFISKTLLR